MNIDFNPNEPTPLCEIMCRNKSDKGHTDIMKARHNYTTVYYSLFKNRQYDNLRFFELGLGTNNVSLPSNMGVDGRPGASLYGWAEFFPNAQIFGADIDKDILFNTDRISTYYCDQTNPKSIAELWSQPPLQENFDIIIEDGLHQFHANICFFENSIHKLKPGGYYIIEDIKYTKIISFKQKINIWKTSYPNCHFKLINAKSPVNNIDNNILVVYKNI